MDKKWLKEQEYNIKSKIKKEVVSVIKNQIEQIGDMNLSTSYSSKTIKHLDQYSNYANDRYFCGPTNMEHWQPGLAEFIVRVAVTAAIEASFAALENVYTTDDFEKDLLGGR